jgi:hypothetical protein
MGSSKLFNISQTECEVTNEVLEKDLTSFKNKDLTGFKNLSGLINRKNMKQYEIQLESGKYYHIYNRGINGTNLFFEERNYLYFLQKYSFYMSDILDTYAYCLLGNHFHLLVRVKELTSFEINEGLTNFKSSEDLTGFKNLSGLKVNKGLHSPDRLVSKKFSDLFNSYTKSINKSQSRTGGLFETPFKRKLVNSETYFTQLIWYIHFNPQKHGFVNDFKDYPYSSYQGHINNKSTKLTKQQEMEWFGSENEYEKFHRSIHSEENFNHLTIEY